MIEEYIEINALSAGMETLAGSAVKNARNMFNFAERLKHSIR